MSAPVLDHITRTPLPWQKTTEDLTECGKRVIDVASAITFEDAKAKVKEQGSQRAALSTCMTCAGRSDYREQHDWSLSPSGALARAIERQPWRALGSDMCQLDRELLALAAIAEAHRGEFEAYVDGLGQTTSLDAARARKRKER